MPSIQASLNPARDERERAIAGICVLCTLDIGVARATDSIQDGVGDVDHVLLEALSAALAMT